MKPFKQLNSVSSYFDSEFETAPSSFKNWKERKVSAPTLIGQKPLNSYPTFVY
jgi:hypothetical protein